MSYHEGQNSTTTKVSPSSPMNRTTKVWFTFHYRNPSRRKSGAFQQRSGAQPTTGLGAPEQLQVTTQGSQPPHGRLGSKDPRVTSSQAFNFHESSWRAQTDAQSNGKSTNAQILHYQIPPQATNAYGGRREEEQRRTQQMELQDLDRKGSPHLEEKRIG